MELFGLLGILLLAVIILLLIKVVIDSIEFVLLVLLATAVLVYFFGISLSDVSAWISAQTWLISLAQSLLKALLFSLQSS